MRWVWISVLVLGLAVTALGVLWFLQGSDVVQINPILCVGDCEPVTGHQPVWQVAGGIAGLVGVFLAVSAARKARAIDR
jgi:formate-dependent nitrite reductase membrane component NrfD